MPARRVRRASKPRRRVARVRRGRRIPRTLNAMRDRAKVVEVYESIDFPGQTGGVQQFSLSEFPRALAVAQNYRYYRATRVELEFVPFANVYPSGTAFPELYYQQDYTAFTLAQAPNQAQMVGRGVLPIKWTKPIKKSYNPAVLRFEQMYTKVWNAGAEYYVNDVQPMTATPVKNKWYMTEKAYTPSGQGGNPAVQYNVGPAADPTHLLYTGSAWFVNTPVAIAGNIGRVFVRVHWEFKQPLVQDSTGQNLNVPINTVKFDLSGNALDLSGNLVINA